MTKQDEYLQILNMVRDGKISTEDGAKLLAALEKAGTEKPVDARSIYIRIRENGRDKVNVNIPVHLARMAVNLVPKDVVRDQNIDLQSLVASIEAGFCGTLLDAELPKQGRKIEVIVK